MTNMRITCHDIHRPTVHDALLIACVEHWKVTRSWMKNGAGSVYFLCLLDGYWTISPIRVKIGERWLSNSGSKVIGVVEVIL